MSTTAPTTRAEQRVLPGPRTNHLLTQSRLPRQTAPAHRVGESAVRLPGCPGSRPPHPGRRGRSGHLLHVGTTSGVSGVPGGRGVGDARQRSQRRGVGHTRPTPPSASTPSAATAMRLLFMKGVLSRSNPRFAGRQDSQCPRPPVLRLNAAERPRSPGALRHRSHAPPRRASFASRTVAWSVPRAPSLSTGRFGPARGGRYTRPRHLKRIPQARCPRPARGQHRART